MIKLIPKISLLFLVINPISGIIDAKPRNSKITFIKFIKINNIYFILKFLLDKLLR